jgi:hypothetical protein
MHDSNLFCAPHVSSFFAGPAMGVKGPRLGLAISFGNIVSRFPTEPFTVLFGVSGIDPASF